MINICFKKTVSEHCSLLNYIQFNNFITSQCLDSNYYDIDRLEQLHTRQKKNFKSVQIKFCRQQHVHYNWVMLLILAKHADLCNDKVKSLATPSWKCALYSRIVSEVKISIFKLQLVRALLKMLSESLLFKSASLFIVNKEDILGNVSFWIKFTSNKA
jgi:hypothetical protein